MVFFACNILSCSNPSCALSSEITRTPHILSLWGYSPFVKPTKFGSLNFNFQRALLATNVDKIENVKTKEEEEEEKPRLRFRWVDIGSGISEAQKEALAQLPPKMTKRCKALMKQIICFSPEKTTLSNCLAAWVKIMKPQRADWLSVLKELGRLDHPLLFQVAELALLEESFEANVRDFTKIIHGYGKQNRLQDAESTFSAMRKRGLVCDQVTLTTLVNMYSKAGNLKQAEETFEEMKLIGLPLDRKSYGSMIMAYIRAGMPDHGETLLRDMEAQEIYAGREVYKALLRAYSMIGNSDGAQRVFDSIQFAGITPDVKLCGLLINAYVVAGQSNKASIAFDNLRKAGLEPNDKSVALILTAYEKENKLSKALDFLIELERDGIMVGKESSEVLARWFRRLGVVEEVELVLREYALKEAKSEAPASNSAPGSNPIIKRRMRPKVMIHSRKTKLPSKRSNERIS